MTGLIPFFWAALTRSIVPAREPWSVSATAGICSSAARAARAGMRHAPSRMEYSEWTWRWTKGAVSGTARPLYKSVPTGPFEPAGMVGLGLVVEAEVAVEVHAAGEDEALHGRPLLLQERADIGRRGTEEAGLRQGAIARRRAGIAGERRRGRRPVRQRERRRRRRAADRDRAVVGVAVVVGERVRLRRRPVRRDRRAEVPVRMVVAGDDGARGRRGAAGERGARAGELRERAVEIAMMLAAPGEGARRNGQCGSRSERKQESFGYLRIPLGGPAEEADAISVPRKTWGMRKFFARPVSHAGMR